MTNPTDPPTQSGSASCPRCGNVNPPGSAYCNRCGQYMVEQYGPQPARSSKVPWWLITCGILLLLALLASPVLLYVAWQLIYSSPAGTVPPPIGP